MNRFALLALALALPLAACADDTEPTSDTVVVDTDPAMTTDPMMDEPMMEDTTMAASSDVTAQGTVDAVQNAGGLTSLAPSAALANIDGWIAQLEGNPEFAPVVEDLRTLKTQLQASPINGAEVGATLQRLGEATTANAGTDTALQTLGSTLTSAGNSLAN